MTIKELTSKNLFRVLNPGEDESIEITKPFCCDLLSFAMSKAPVGAAWVTVMGNINTLAVASLTECACIVLAEGAALDETALAKAKQEGIAIFATENPIYETAVEIGKFM